VVYRAWQRARFDAWSEHFQYDAWLQAFQAPTWTQPSTLTAKRPIDRSSPGTHWRSGQKPF
jgi:hypothetical protein